MGCRQMWTRNLKTGPWGCDGFWRLVALFWIALCFRFEAWMWQLAFRVEAYDRYGNKRTSGGECVSFTVAERDGGITSAVRDCQDGSYEVMVQGTRAGMLEGTVLMNGEPISSGVVRIDVVAGSVDAASCCVVDEDFGSVQAGVESTMVIQTKDSFGNVLKIGGVQVEVELVGPVTVAAAVSDGGDGQYTCRYRCEVAGVYSVVPTVARKNIAHSPFRLVVEAADASAKHCSVRGLAASPVTVAKASEFWLEGFDGFGNRCTRELAALEVRGSHENDCEGICTTVLHGGVHAVRFVPRRSGPADLEVRLGGCEIRGSPFTIQVGAGLMHGPSCTVCAGGLGTTAAGERAEVSIQARDAHGNNLKVGQQQLQVRTQGAAPMEHSVRDTADGIYHLSVGAKTSGVYNVRLLMPNGESVGPVEGWSMEVVPATACASECRVGGADALVGVCAGEQAALQLQAIDRYGNRCRRGGDKVGATSVDGAVIGAVTDTGDGQYSVLLKFEMAGASSVVLKINGSTVAGSPFSASVQAGKVCAPKCVATGNGLERAVAAEDAMCMLQLYDDYGNPVRRTGVELSAELTGPASITPVVLERDSGVYMIRYSAVKTGNYQLALCVGSDHVHGSPFSVAVLSGPSCAAQCTASGAALQRLVAGEMGRFTIEAADRNGQRREGGGDCFSVWLEGASRSLGAVKDMADGSYTVSYTTCIGGKYSLCVTLGGQHIQGSPFEQLTVASERCAALSTVSTDGGGHAIRAGDEAVLSVSSRDMYGNAVCSGGAKVELKCNEIARRITAETSDDGNGRYSVRYSVEVSGTYELQVLMDGKTVMGSPIVVDVEPASTDGAKSVVVASSKISGMAGSEVWAVGRCGLGM